MKQTRYGLAIFGFCLLFHMSCSKDSSTPTPIPNPPGGGNNPTCANATQGPLFSQVKTLLANNCVTCHSPSGQMPSVDFRDNCVIEGRSALIKTRAVDQGTMPPTGALAQADKDKISAWVAAGGKVTD